MGSCNHDERIPTQTIYPESKNLAESAEPPDYGLPTISEDWDFSWAEDLFSGLDAEDTFQQNVPPVIAEPNQPFDTMAQLQQQIQDLKQDMSELHSTFTMKLESLEKNMHITQAYLKKLVPWSSDVRESYSMLWRAVNGQDQVDT